MIALTDMEYIFTSIEVCFDFIYGIDVNYEALCSSEDFEWSGKIKCKVFES